jgi:hypothetical protein
LYGAAFSALSERGSAEARVGGMASVYNASPLQAREYNLAKPRTAVIIGFLQFSWCTKLTSTLGMLGKIFGGGATRRFSCGITYRLLS